jgi:hypothetical protein
LRSRRGRTEREQRLVTQESFKLQPASPGVIHDSEAVLEPNGRVRHLLHGVDTRDELLLATSDEPHNDAS